TGSLRDAGVARGMLALACLPLAVRPIRFGLGVAALFLVSSIQFEPTSRELYRARSFFGISRVVIGSNSKVHSLIHRHVEHGAQAFSDDPETRFAPFMHFHPRGPIGQVMLAHMEAHATAPIGVIGLGAGSLAYYGQAGQEFTYFEIDPVVKEIAEDPTY